MVNYYTIKLYIFKTELSTFLPKSTLPTFLPILRWRQLHPSAQAKMLSALYISYGLTWGVEPSSDMESGFY